MGPLIMFKHQTLIGATVCRVETASRKLPGKNQRLLPSLLLSLCFLLSLLSPAVEDWTGPTKCPGPIIIHSVVQRWDHGIFFCDCLQSSPLQPPCSVSWRKGLLAQAGLGPPPSLKYTIFKSTFLKQHSTPWVRWHLYSFSKTCY